MLELGGKKAFAPIRGGKCCPDGAPAAQPERCCNRESRAKITETEKCRFLGGEKACLSELNNIGLPERDQQAK